LSIHQFYQYTSLIYGLLIGSFLNVVIYRLPQAKSVVRPRSSCPKCGHQIRWYENIPLLSFLFLKGKCSQCETSIPLRYPLIELLVGAFFYARFPIAFEGLFLYSYIFELVVFCLFVCIFFIDLDHHIIPDSLNIALGLLFLTHAFIQHRWQSALIGAGLAFAFTFGFTYLFYKLRGVIGLGGGDIKLFTALGAQLGVQGIVYNIFLSCFVGAIIGLSLLGLKKISSDRPFAFGPSIIAVSVLQILYPSYFEMIMSFLIS
jgi:prepilin signal peptidase PulO-like enzyme (type II secretory pathway)